MLKKNVRNRLAQVVLAGALPNRIEGVTAKAKTDERQSNVKARLGRLAQATLTGTLTQKLKTESDTQFPALLTCVPPADAGESPIKRGESPIKRADTPVSDSKGRTCLPSNIAIEECQNDMRHAYKELAVAGRRMTSKKSCQISN
jgi:hypothetical protein